VHVKAFTVLNHDCSRTPFQATNQATTEINYSLQYDDANGGVPDAISVPPPSNLGPAHFPMRCENVGDSAGGQLSRVT
jgi:hypothetical protein